MLIKQPKERLEKTFYASEPPPKRKPKSTLK